LLWSLPSLLWSLPSLLCLLILVPCDLYTQTTAASAPAEPQLAFSTDAPLSHRFIAAHGRRALIDGYAGAGIEAWIYPFQIFRAYQVAFMPDGATTAIPAEELLSRVEYEPGSITRIYLGPGFIARERLFVPIDQPGAIITYTVQSSKPVDIQIHATPVLDLMWPAATGGQSVQWNAALHAFALSEPGYGYSAIFGSPDIVAHDELGNRTNQGPGGMDVGFTLRTDSSGNANVFIALNPPHPSDQAAIFNQLVRDRDNLHAEAAAHYKACRQTSLQLTTPDTELNDAFASAEVALDQAWVCNADLGCGYVGGYGPSRGARRPQYDWFFAGDGMVAADAALAAGDLVHARDELAFILRYQDRKSGMIWHELSQSAGLIDWVGKYPYMYVHVDITFDFLGTVGRYVAASGDVAFVRDHWQAIEEAYRYCNSLIDSATSLPRIPADKEGGNEQQRMADDLGLSTAWVSASDAVSNMASLVGNTALAHQAATASQSARSAIPKRYWSDSDSFWISGHTTTRQPMVERRSGATAAIAMGLFSANQNDSVLDQLATSSFQTDWGTRGIGADSKGYDPDSYAQGSVWPVGTSSLASTFWSEHRPVTAMAVWRTLIPLNALDSIGHIDEVLAGNFYRPQTESVPEQTWSSAGFVQSTVHGLLGLEVDSIAHRIVFAPRLPVTWENVSVQHIPVAGQSVCFALRRSGDHLTLHIENPGEPLHLEFAPDLPLGAQLVRATLNQHPISGTIENYPQQTNAKVEADIPHGPSDLDLNSAGGVSVIPETIRPRLGDTSSGIKIISVHLDGTELTIDADIPTTRASHVQLYTAWHVTGGRDVQVQPIAEGEFDVMFAASPGTLAPWRHARTVVQIKR
jgi:glycogen debranching enzyme